MGKSVNWLTLLISRYKRRTAAACTTRDVVTGQDFETARETVKYCPLALLLLLYNRKHSTRIWLTVVSAWQGIVNSTAYLPALTPSSKGNLLHLLSVQIIIFVSNSISRLAPPRASLPLSDPPLITTACTYELNFALYVYFKNPFSAKTNFTLHVPPNPPPLPGGNVYK